jgi:hypothetical protein
MAGAPSAEVLIVSLGSTEGLRRADEQLRSSIERAGVSASIAAAARPLSLRTLAATDLAWALSARAAARRALAAASRPPRAVIYSTTTAALLWPAPGAIRFDATADGNRPGRHGVWQRPLERRRLEHATMLLPWSDGALRERRGPLAYHDVRVVPVAVAPSGPPAAERDIAAITYAANPLKKGLDRVLAAWSAVQAERPLGEELLITGTTAEECARAGIATDRVPGVRLLGPLSTDEYFALVRRARVFVSAPRREDYGIAQLEALADGCMLVTTPSPGPYAALPIARSLDPRIVGDELAHGLREALARPLPDYAARAAAALDRYSPASVDELVARELLPRLLG